MEKHEGENKENKINKHTHEIISVAGNMHASYAKQK